MVNHGENGGETTMENHYAGGQQDNRPWGRWTVLEAGPGYVVKRIEVTPGHRLSLQRHRHRAEQWIVVQGRARVTRGDARFDLGAGESAAIARGDIHRVENQGPALLVFIEVQTGAVLSEEDIERLEDAYGRAGGA